MPTDAGITDIHLPDAIFDDALYEKEVLLLSDGCTEDALDEQLFCDARAVGIKDPEIPTAAQDVSTAISTLTISTEQRSSVSINSRASHSTSMTSNPSRSSKEHQRRPSSSSPGKARSSASFLGGYPVAKLGRSTPLLNNSNSSLPTAASSLLSLASTTSKKSPSVKRKRRSNILSRFRRDSTRSSMSQEAESTPVQEMGPQLDGENGVASTRTILPVSQCETDGSLQRAMQYPAYRDLRRQAQEEAQRFLFFQNKQQRALPSYYEWTCACLRDKNRRLEAEMEQQHAHALEQLEERHLSAELDLLTGHAEERQNVLTALKYMEAYCNNNNANSTAEPKRVVTDEDRQALRRQYGLRDRLDTKHNAAIAVLRGKQDKDAKQRAQKQRQELATLERHFEAAMERAAALNAQDAGRLEALADARRKRMVARWNLRVEMWRKGREAAAEEEAVPEPVPRIEWADAVAQMDPAGGVESVLDGYARLGTSAASLNPLARGADPPARRAA